MRRQATSRTFVAGVIGAVLAFGTLETGLQAASFEPVTLPGTGDSTDVLRELAAAYTAQYPDRQVIVPNSIGSDGGVRVVGNRRIPIVACAQADHGGAREVRRVPLHGVRARAGRVRGEPEDGRGAPHTRRRSATSSAAASRTGRAGGNDLPIDVQARPEDGSNMGPSGSTWLVHQARDRAGRAHERPQSRSRRVDEELCGPARVHAAQRSRAAWVPDHHGGRSRPDPRRTSSGSASASCTRRRCSPASAIPRLLKTDAARAILRKTVTCRSRGNRWRPTTPRSSRSSSWSTTTPRCRCWRWRRSAGRLRGGGSDGRRGSVEIFARCSPDIVLLDVNLPSGRLQRVLEHPQAPERREHPRDDDDGADDSTPSTPRTMWGPRTSSPSPCTGFVLG